MTIAEKNLPIKMSRANLDNVPEFALPDGFSLRWYQPGDEAHWPRIHLVADRYNEITPELFRKQFGVAQERGLQSTSASEGRSGMNSALRDLGERQCYLLASTGNAIGTGTAWFTDDFEGCRWGRVRWMAIMPEFQGTWAGKTLMTAICRRLRELDHDRACLSTSTARHAAIGLYLKFGFEPLIRSEEEAALWRELLPFVLRKA